jgi:uncharacterized Zn finger protein (UPF0148 family)
MTKASCPHCHKFISDQWVKQEAIALASRLKKKPKRTAAQLRNANRRRQQAFQERKRIQELQDQLARADFLTVA